MLHVPRTKEPYEAAFPFLGGHFSYPQFLPYKPLMDTGHLHACVQIFLYRIKSNVVHGCNGPGDVLVEHSKSKAVPKAWHGL